MKLKNSMDRMKKINITKAERLYNEGQEIYVIPCKASRFYGEIVKNGVLVQKGVFWCCIEKACVENESFKTIINKMLFYTPKELGKYFNYYVLE